jgi:hypothetical protein
MNVLYRIVILVFCINGSYCVKYDYREEQLRCIQACGVSSNRLCQQPPSVCGDCLPQYEDRQGACKPLEFSNDESANAGSHGTPVNDDKESLQEFQLKPVKKEESGMNYAVNQSSGEVIQHPTEDAFSNNILFIAVIACVSAAAVIGIIIAIICWCKLKKSAKASSDFEYPGYGSMDYKGEAIVTKSTADRRLAQSAQMYHYQHQKQQMLEMEKNQNAVSKSGSEASSDEENDASEYTVYECPGLATAGEIEVPNPLFSEPPPSALSPEAVEPPPTDDQEPALVNGFKEP